MRACVVDIYCAVTLHCMHKIPIIIVSVSANCIFYFISLSRNSRWLKHMIRNSPSRLNYTLHGFTRENGCSWGFYFSVLFYGSSRLMKLFNVVRVAFTTNGLVISDTTCLHASVLLMVSSRTGINNIHSVTWCELDSFH